MSRVFDPPRERRARPGNVEASAAALLFVGAVLETVLTEHSAPVEADALAVAVTTLPLAWRSIAPLGTSVVTTGGLALATVLGFPAGDLIVPYLAPLVAVYSLGVNAPRREILAGVGMVLAAFTVVVLTSPSGQLSDLAPAAGGTAMSLAVGLAVRRLGFETDTLAAHAAELERSRDESTRAAVAAERARIARELHDVIGHSISVMGIQAGAVRSVLSPELKRERDALLGVERVGRDAVTEMRLLLGFLRPTDGSRQDVKPTPTLERLDELVTDMKLAGLDLDLVIDGELRGLSAGRALTAFRILQEALTNVLRHAPGSHVRAVLRRSSDELVIEVQDDGADGLSVAATDGGYGLIGMRERVALYGGTLEAGPRPGRGYAVVAHLPTADR